MSNILRTPPTTQRPLSEAYSNPDLFCTPDMAADLNTNVRKRKCLNVSPAAGPSNDHSNESIPHSMQLMFNNVQQMFIDLKLSQNEQFSQIKQEITSLITQNEALLTSNAEINKSLTKIIEEQNELKKRVEVLEKKDNHSEAYVRGLESQVENVERKIRETCIEINNLPTENNVQMLDIIEQIHKTLQVEYNPRDIRSAYRLPAKNNSLRPIIIEYTQLQKKIEILQAYKKFNITHKGERLNTSSIGRGLNKNIIYINEFLTKKGKHLHYLARKLIKNGDWKFCWTINGKIFIRKEEGETAIEVRSDDQIATLSNNKD